ncbi:MAG: phosphomethylpyrimidine synthase ThiC [Methanothrix sp.]|jgi:phosphomethylpyrimidine synthase|uniref:Phosphomethylpyrimidine synthase n=1 Tax=Methanothrix harundinacea TaxID=301375 RepID=A0A101FT54_9EURY|nr:MAG: Phosphomethylpyrimidine synthase [Methanothrix harundinacea]MDD2637619.1 phosphomethylpyrimidine synthase ThiC [Methanothrix sp.]MDI9399113.1 phosphomethylpyrimidine synthase ThiC [Euryarchaeota archaeon]KUK96421.1 MAG: Phosphomethylpyrimidine synthase [Methanothrix harundinacea]MCP1393113.1 phosphomethylpyrimidine synthase ThiC [Methanothrix harundinacea]
MTLIEDAKKGITPPEVEIVARKEGVDPEKLVRLLALGRVVIPRNVRRKIDPIGVGESLTTKVNLNLGSSRGVADPEAEVEKAVVAMEAGADTVMDLSTGGDLDLIRRRVLAAVKIPVGTVPIYQAEVAGELTSQGLFDALERQAKDGVDFVTVHVGVNLNSFERLKRSHRIMGVVSRGGSLTLKYMSETGEENPYYAEYDHLLDIAREHDLTLSLGDGLRPGCIDDASDRAKYMEFIMLGELVDRARKAGVQAMVEGPGHVPADEIETSVRAMKYVTDGAPLYLLGPIVTDVAPGYDHITAAIGGTIAGMNGADFLCATTPSEHLDLPTKEDIFEGTIVTRIAAHAADLAKAGVKDRARLWDRKMAVARRDLDWPTQFDLSINPSLARQIRHRRGVDVDTCTMCNELCAIRLAREAMERERDKEKRTAVKKRG